MDLFVEAVQTPLGSPERVARKAQLQANTMTKAQLVCIYQQLRAHQPQCAVVSKARNKRDYVGVLVAALETLQPIDHMFAALHIGNALQPSVVPAPLPPVQAGVDGAATAQGGEQHALPPHEAAVAAHGVLAALRARLPDHTGRRVTGYDTDGHPSYDSDPEDEEAPQQPAAPHAAAGPAVEDEHNVYEVEDNHITFEYEHNREDYARFGLPPPSPRSDDSVDYDKLHGRAGDSEDEVDEDDEDEEEEEED